MEQGKIEKEEDSGAFDQKNNLGSSSKNQT
jgi:hypothetical protein